MKRLYLLGLIAALIVVAGCGGNPTPVVEVTRSLVTAVPTITPQPAATNTPLRVAPPNTPTPLTVEQTTDASPTMTTPTVAPSPEPTATPTPLLEPDFSAFPPAIGLSELVNIGERITDLTHAGDGSGRIFISTQAGRILILQNGSLLPAPFLNISDRVTTTGNEQGLLGLAFDPEYAATGEFYVNYSSLADAGATVVARYRVSDDANLADAGSEQRILVIDQPAANHNAGQLKFGPDGFLYVGTGDGGDQGDPWDNAENMGVLLGKMLRIAPRGQESYAIPADNPFVDRPDARDEIWAYGLRNPWRYSFDRLTGDLFISDVGQNSFEEINFVAAGSPGGMHFGWDTVEGNSCFEPATDCGTEGTTPPIYVYGHDQGCSITGGYIYRGDAFPSLRGTYFLADYCSGKIWGLRQSPTGEWAWAELLDTQLLIPSFGEDEAGEIYVLEHNGRIFRLTDGG